MKQRILKYLTLGAFIATLASCITDVNTIGGGNNGDGRPTVLSFHPQMGGHGGATRGATYDETWEEFERFFGGDDQQGDIFFSTDLTQFPHGYGREVDRTIATFRVMVFYGSGNSLGTPGDLVFWNGTYANHLFTWGQNSASGGFQFELPTGNYDFLFVANDQGLFGDDNTTGSGGADNPADPTAADGNAVNLAAVKQVLFTYDGEIHDDKHIPMVTWIPSVDVDLGSISFTDLDGTYEAEDDKVVFTSEWPVWMKRSAIRLSFGFHMGAAQYAAWKAYHGSGEPLLYIDGLRNKGWAFPRTGSGGALTAATDKLAVQQLPASTATTEEGIRPGKIIEHPTDGSAEVFFDRLIYPEYLPVDPESAAGALRAYMRFDYGGRVDEKEMLIHRQFSSPDEADYSLPRNTWVWTRAVVLTDMDYTVRVVPWGDGPVDPVNFSQYNLVTDRSEMLFRAAGHNERMTVFTDHPEDWTADPADVDFGDGAPDWFAVSPVTGPTGATTMMTVTARPNDTGSVRSGSFIIRAGNIFRTITVVQLPASGEIVDTAQSKATMYVGAFWKAAQYGERLIRIDRTKVNPVQGFDGPWSAYVVEGDDWIKLDTEQSSDDGVGTTNPDDNGNDNGFDATHAVGGYRTSVSGTMGVGDGRGDIYFRVGLNGPYIPTADRPARYGMILLQYTNGGSPAYQRIWVRQGEGDDYLMQPDQELPAGAGPREKARLFSPYNLTVDEFMTSNSTTPFVDVRPGGIAPTTTFTHYPTQAGAHFRWADFIASSRAAVVHAFNPVISQEHKTQHYILSWDSKYESCPPGYRRPADRAHITVDPANHTKFIPVAESEMHQSLLQVAVDGEEIGDTSNSVWGYYADGFFDRRQRATQPGNSSGENNAVDTDMSTVAYAGRLFYNLERGNSLFFPAAGSHHNVGYGEVKMMDAGAIGSYWSSAIHFQSNGMGFRVANNTARRFSQANRLIYSIRCVVDPGTSMLTVTPPTLDEVAYTGATRTVTVRSLDENGVVVGWEVAGFDGDDANDSFTIGEKPDWLDMPLSGDGGRLTGQPVEITINPNPNPAAGRTIRILFAQEDNPAITATLTVTQAPAPPPPVPAFSQVYTVTTSNVPVEHSGLYYIEAWGGDGGAGGKAEGMSPGAGGDAGKSEIQAGLFRLTKGDILNIQVGRAGKVGGDGRSGTSSDGSGGTGGAGGTEQWFGAGHFGGNGGRGAGSYSGAGGGGSGGSASGVLVNGTAVANLMIASGGGGGGAGGGADSKGGNGGNGGVALNSGGSGGNGSGGGPGTGGNDRSETSTKGADQSTSRLHGADGNSARGNSGGGGGGGGWDGSTGGGGQSGNGATGKLMNAGSGGGGAGGASFTGGSAHVSDTSPYTSVIDARTITEYNTTRSDSGRGGLVIISYLGSEVN